eukprot:TRINITY_DN5057_c0_g1_i1.p1 TRINITY_DN5057_c0_g1~~TRINITY_DN5057_c0_g1_i1.p1  ORF type:complete len:156 (+),score=22.49 TRINITY_DN5057_c0_g1_i1:71-538(+)
MKNEVAYMVMAESLSYYDLCFRRFGDSSAMCVEAVLIKRIAAEIESHIFKSLEIWSANAEETLKSYLEESKEVAERRQQLEDSLDRLLQIQRELSVYAVGAEFETTSVAESKELAYATRDNVFGSNQIGIGGSMEAKSGTPEKKKRGLMEKIGLW